MTGTDDQQDLDRTRCAHANGDQSFQLLARALTRLHLARSPDEIAAALGAETARLTGSVGLCLLTPGGERLHYGTAQVRETLAGQQAAELFATLAAWLKREGGPVQVPDAQHDARLPAGSVPVGIGGLVAVPLDASNSGGALAACWSRRHTPAADELALLQALARAAWDALVRWHAEERRRQSEERLGAIFKHAPVGLCELSLEGQFLRVNDALCRLLGRSRDELLTLSVPDVTHPDDVDHSVEALQQLIATGQPASLDKRYVRADGELVWANSSITRLEDLAGRPEGILAVTVDLTRRKLAEDALRASESRYRTLTELSPDGLLVSRDGRYVYANAAAVRLLGAQEMADIAGRSALGLVEPDWRPVAEEQICRLQGQQSAAASLAQQRWRRLDGRLIDLEVAAGPIEWEGEPAVQIVLRDITERQQAAMRIWRHANFDALTQLPNRRLFRDRLEQEVKKAARADAQLALFFLDLDGFKQVNDLLGHDVGDQLLVQAAQRLTRCVRQADTVARLGGDEFTVILGELMSVEPVDNAAQKIIDAMSQPFHLGQETVYLSASLGITVFPGDAKTPEELIRNADQAMYAAKRTGKNQFTYFTREMDRKAHQRLRMASDLRRAVREGQLQVHYQPVVDLAAGHIAKAEALVRWYHPGLGWVAPSVFIPLAEESGLIRDIGDWVFYQAACCAKHLSGLERARPLQITINKSPAQFLRPAADSGWLRVLAQLGLSGESIAVEITEGVLLDASSAVTDKLLAYRDAGIQVAIDDFGTGYSSLAYLKKFDIDYLKIDRSFVSDMASDTTNQTIAETIIVMAHQLGLEVIAEGIETPQQLALLKAAGCDYGQGFLFSKPLPAAGFSRLVTAGP